MLRAAALLPPTVMLALPSAPPAFDAVRSAASSAVDSLVASGAERIVVVCPVTDRRAMPSGGLTSPVASRLSGPLHPTFRSAGMDDDRSGLDGVVIGAPVRDARLEEAIGPAGPVDDVPAAVALALLATAGWDRQLEVVEVSGADAESLRALGSVLAQDDVALLLMGGLSARRGPDAPLAEDPRAPEVDAALAEDLARLGAGEDSGAVARLGAFGRALAEDLAISAWAPWQVLLGALGTAVPGLRASVHVSVPAGATYAVIAWAHQ